METDGSNLSKNDEKMGKIILKVDKSAIHEENNFSSPIADIGGFKWHLEMHNNADKKPGICNNFFDVNIFCELNNTSMAEVEKLWICKAAIRMSAAKRSRSGKCLLFFTGLTCHTLCSCKFEEVDGIMSTELEVEVKWHNLQLTTQAFETDLKLLFNGKEEIMAVNKFALASLSSYFRNLFFGNWSERSADQQQEFTIEEEADFDVNMFKLMIYAPMAMGWMAQEGDFLQVQTAMNILKLSTKYDVPMMQDYCQKYLLNSSDCPKMELLVLAEQLGLQQLKDHCLAKITAVDMTKNFSHNTEICAMSKRTRKRLEERLNESAKKAAERRPKKVQIVAGPIGNAGSGIWGKLRPEIFRATRYPDDFQREDLAANTNLSGTQVQNWFQRRRNTARRLQLL